jgi:Fe-S cluster assembly ATP-binding protein
MLSLLSITDLHVSVEGKPVIRGLDLTIHPGEIHAVMGPNGSGKSTLVNTLMGHPKYTVMAGSATFQGKDLFLMDAAERARAGLFLAFQYPKEIAGVTLRSFLFAAYKAQMPARRSLSQVVEKVDGEGGGARNPDKKVLSPIKFKVLLEEHMNALQMDPSFAERFVNKGFSGGEKKKAEILQMRLLQPLLALLDETDSGLDIDALKIVAEGINRVRDPQFSALLVTHYARLLEHVRPDRVHVMIAGKIVESGGMELAEMLEKEGYARYGVREGAIELKINNE